MKLDDAQRQKVTAWINEGLKLAEIQTRLEKDLGLRMTYLDVRLLVDELKLVPKDPVVVAAETKPVAADIPSAPALGEDVLPEPEMEPEPEQPAAGGKVSVSVDQLTRPGAVVSGKVTFSDGKISSWFLDELGRLGIAPSEKGYKPPAGDVQLFQMELQKELQKLGF